VAEELRPKVLVVGGGPGGYVAAIRCGQLGLDTVLVEGERLGGTCLIRGCIPSKAMIHVASEVDVMRRASQGAGRHGVKLSAPPTVDLPQTVAWKETVVDKLNGGVTALLKRAKVKVVEGFGVFEDAKTCRVQTAAGEVMIRPETVILAAGSKAVELPHIPFGGPVISSTEALALDALPERLVVVGAGYIGLELGIAYRKFGCQVTVVEAQDRILPLYDDQLTAPVRRWLEKNGVTLMLGAKAQGVEADADAHVLVVETAEGETLRVPADKVLVTVGRRPFTEGWGLENTGVAMSGRFVKVDDTCATSMKGVYAIGDLVGEPMLAHKASAQGEMVAEIIAGHRRRFDPVSISAVCFTEPEVVSAGLLPTDPGGSGEGVVTAIFPFQANGRALSMEAGDDGGFVRVIARKEDHRLLGVQAVGAHVSELVAEFTLALEMGATLEDVAGAIHVHPTLSEGFHEATQRVLGHAIHI
jgi:dihydrolipoamide dehydrogenase